MSLGFPSAFLLFLLRKPKLKTRAKASGCQLLSGNKAFLVERSFHGAAKSLRAARASYYRSSRYRDVPAPHPSAMSGTTGLQLPGQSQGYSSPDD